MSMYIRDAREYLSENTEGCWTKRTGLEQKLIILVSCLLIASIALAITVIVLALKSPSKDSSTTQPQDSSTTQPQYSSTTQPVSNDTTTNETAFNTTTSFTNETESQTFAETTTSSTSASVVVSEPSNNQQINL